MEDLILIRGHNKTWLKKMSDSIYSPDFNQNWVGAIFFLFILDSTGVILKNLWSIWTWWHAQLLQICWLYIHVTNTVFHHIPEVIKWIEICVLLNLLEYNYCTRLAEKRQYITFTNLNFWDKTEWIHDFMLLYLILTLIFECFCFYTAPLHK